MRKRDRREREGEKERERERAIRKDRDHYIRYCRAHLLVVKHIKNKVSNLTVP